MSWKASVHGEGTASLLNVLGWVFLIFGGLGALVLFMDAVSAPKYMDAGTNGFSARASSVSLVSSVTLLVSTLFIFAVSLGFAAHLRNQGQMIRLQAQALTGSAIESRRPVAPEAVTGAAESGPTVPCAGSCQRRIPARSANFFKGQHFCDEDYRRAIG